MSLKNTLLNCDMITWNEIVGGCVSSEEIKSNCVKLEVVEFSFCSR